uniref:Mur ligase family protein n=1 Tax=Erythrobacter sp. TaxID=1042 RepID=UPI00311FBBF2
MTETVLDASALLALLRDEPGAAKVADAIADAKAEILEGAGADDVLVCNADDPRIAARTGGFSGRTVTFGMTAAGVGHATVSA